MTEYTPTTEDARKAFESAYSRIEPSERGPAFDKWLRKIQARAWEQGYLAMNADMVYGTGTENPYD